MADTKRKQITDRFVTVLAAVPTLRSATQDLDTWSAAAMENMPLAMVDAQKPEVRRSSFPHPTANDMEAYMEIRVHLQMMSLNIGSKRGDFDAIMQDIEQAIVGDSTLNGLVLDVTLLEDEIDVGTDETRGYGLMLFGVTYQYNHNTP